MNQRSHMLETLFFVLMTSAATLSWGGEPGALSEGEGLNGPEPNAANAPNPSNAPNPTGRVILLGFDGADARTIRELMTANPEDYPTFRRLAEEGTFAPLEVVAPPESPVSWAALNTGQNPAKTGVPGFIRRELKTSPIPGFGHLRKEEAAPIGELANLPLPLWSEMKMAAVAGGAIFVLVALLTQLILRGALLRTVGVIVALGAGGAGAWAGYTARGFIPETVPITRNPNQARNLWDYAAEAGVPCVVLDAAQAWDMPAPDGARVLAGLGVPDARGGLGDWFVYTTDPAEFSREGRGTTTAGTVYRVDEYDGVIQTQIHGPDNFWLDAELAKIDAALKDPTISIKKSTALSSRYIELKDQKDEGTSVDMKIALEPDQNRVRVEIGGQEQVIGVGEWSEFFELSFELNPLLAVKAITRARLVQIEPYFELFVNVLDIDPREPPFWQPISSPPDFASELAADCGLYETYGWPTTTMPVKDGEIDPELLMEDVEFTMKWRERLTQSVLGRDDWRFCMSVFSTTDRVQHMMYRFYDEEHPLFDREAADRQMTFFGETIRLGDAVPAIYKQMDRVVGDVLASLEPEDTLLVCSDHGFQSFRRQVNVNNWLAENGYLALKPSASKKNAKFLLFVDWEKTRVYSLGMGFLYLNLEGREPKGIVKAGEADALMQEVREKLLAATDPDSGARFCDEVYVTSQIHDGPYLDLESDMIIGFAPPYRVSWSSTSGGLAMTTDDMGLDVPASVCTDNDSPWSGGHVSMALQHVQGVFFSNKEIDAAGGIHALEIAPTVLDLLGVPVPAEMDRESLSSP